MSGCTVDHHREPCPGESVEHPSPAGSSPRMHAGLRRMRVGRRWVHAERTPTRETTMNPTSTPDTIVLIHGFWVTPRSWEQWIPYYEAKGFRVLAPAYPGFEVEVEALNADPTPVEALTVEATIEHLESVIGSLKTPPILMAHSAG